MYIQLNIFDKNNILHRFIISISNMIQDLLKLKNKISINKSVFISIEYQKQIIFIGHINFTGLN
jgi:hypothetical protein